MAKAPKAPGKNPPSDLNALADALETHAVAVGDGYWQSQVLLGSLVAVAQGIGDARARTLLARVTFAPWRAQGTAHVAEGLARAGETEAARAALAEALEQLGGDEVQGEAGTLAWRAAAYAHGALGDEEGVDRCLDEALRCAEGEKRRASQSWPHLAVGYAVLGRDERLRAHFREHAPGSSLSFDDACAAEIIVRRAVERGDAEGFARWCEALGERNGYLVSTAFKEGAPLAAKAHPDALLEMVAAFASNRSYGDEGCATVAWKLAAEGRVDLARAASLAALTHATGDAPRIAASVQRYASNASDEEPGDGLHSFVDAFQGRWARDPAAACALADAREPALRAALANGGSTACENLAALGMALSLVGESARGSALLQEALTHAAGLAGGAKASALRSIGLAASARDLGDAGLFALRKLSSKSSRTEVSKVLSLSYVHARDYAGAVAVVAMGEGRPLSQAMRLCDALSAAVGAPRAFVNHV